MKKLPKPEWSKSTKYNDPYPVPSGNRIGAAVRYTGPTSRRTVTLMQDKVDGGRSDGDQNDSPEAGLWHFEQWLAGLSITQKNELQAIIFRKLSQNATSQNATSQNATCQNATCQERTGTHLPGTT